MSTIFESETRSLNINYTPLNASCEIVAYGGVPDRQTYNSRDGGFNPDYQKTHLCLYPKCNASNPSKETVSESVNDSLTSVAWYELVYNSSTKKYVRGSKITTGSNYQVVESSGDGLVAGMLIVKKNAATNNPLRFEFEANYIDNRSKQIIRYRGQKSIFCDDTEKPVPILHVTPRAVKYNPLEDANNQTFEAMLTDGKNDVTDSKNTRYYWYRKTNINGNNYSLELITGSAENDIDVVSLPTKIATVDGKDVNVYGNKLTVNRNLIGEGAAYVCKAMYRVDGLKSSDTFDNTDPIEEMAITRIMPVIKITYSGVGDTSDENLKYINPIAQLSYRDTPIADPLEYFDVNWYVKKPTDTEFSLAATGLNPQIPFTDGMQLKVAAIDKGPYKVIVDDAGNRIVADDGSYLITK